VTGGGVARPGVLPSPGVGDVAGYPACEIAGAVSSHSRCGAWNVGAAKEVPSLTIAGSITLIVIGAILRWGITWQPKNVDLQVIGLILIIAGVVGLAIAVALLLARRRDRSSAQVYEERRYTQPPT
jgi:hypothetical protein